MNIVLIWAIRLVELLFVIGCVGSVIVIVISGVEDIETILGGEDDSEGQTAQPAK